MPSDVITLYQLPVTQQIEILCCHCALLKTWEYEDLAAPYWRFYWVDREGASVTVNGKGHNLHPNAVVLIPPQTHFSCRNRGIVGFLYIHFFVEARYQQDSRGILTLPLARKQIQFLRGYVDKFPTLEKEDVSPDISLPLAMVILALRMTDRARWISDFKDERIAKALTVIESTYPRAVRNRSLSQTAGMNTNAFILMFKRVTNHTPRQYLQSLRLKEASSLLHHSDLSIEEIAERTGFNDRQHLNMIFRKQFGMTPAQFRQTFLKP